jgi:hypothetical protein
VGSATKINMSCKFAADHTGMVQTPYCCRDLQANENNPKVNEATDCMFVPHMYSPMCLSLY